MSMTREEVLALPVTVDLLTTARALGIGRSTAYELARRGEYPLRLYRVGQRYRATRADLLAALNIDDPSARANGAAHPSAGTSAEAA
jgi:excisionase family DNA binding protein